jgi:hypothetical protein
MFIVLSCYTPTEYVTTANADLSEYTYAMISELEDYSGDAAFYDAEVRIYNAIEEAGFEMVGETEASGLNEDKQRLLLKAKFAVSQSQYESVVTITFYDYLTGRLLGNATGAHGTGWTVKQDLRRATEKAIIQVQEMFEEDR